jgi:hypothetical protein
MFLSIHACRPVVVVQLGRLLFIHQLVLYIGIRILIKSAALSHTPLHEALSY